MNLVYLIWGFYRLFWALMTDWRRFSELIRLSPEIRMTEQVAFLGFPKMVLAAVPFGNYRLDGPSANTNYRIATTIDGILERATRTVRVFTQQEIGDLLSRGLVTAFIPKNKMDWVETWQLLSWFRSQFDEPVSLPAMMLVGYRYHVWRCALIARKLGFNVFVHRQSLDIKTPDPESGQWWTRSNWVYIPWEYLSRLVLLGQGRI